jgi:hypothetical protein
LYCDNDPMATGDENLDEALLGLARETISAFK